MWLGEIPSHWEESAIKALTRVVSRKNKPSEPLLSVYRDYGVILKSSRDDNYNRPGQDLSAYKYVKPTNLVLNKMKTWQGSLGVSELHGIVSPAYITCELDISNVFPRYLHYLLRCRNYIHEYNRLSYGVRTNQWDMRYDDFKKIPVFLPSKQEQRAIAKFLDRKTVQIDCFIANKEKLIAQLNEQKTAIIRKAVTKGINLDATLKPSGIEEVGDVPEHWDLIKTKYLFRLVTDPAPTNNDYELLSIYTNIGVRPRKELEEKGNKATTTDGYWIVKKGDFIVNKLLAWMGAIGLSSYDGVTSPAYDILRKTRPLNERFYDYLFRCGIYFLEFKRRSRGIMEVRLRLYFDQFGQIPLVLPSIEEQDKIVAYLGEKTSKIDAAIAKAQKEIELIKQYRQVLISQAVTGKIDVRETA